MSRRMTKTSFPKPALQGVVNGVVNDCFAVRPNRVNLFEAAVTAAHAGGENEQSWFGHLLNPKSRNSMPYLCGQRKCGLIFTFSNIIQIFSRNFAQVLAISFALRMAETTQMRCAPAARTSPRFSRLMPPIANHGTVTFAAAQRTIVERDGFRARFCARRKHRSDGEVIRARSQRAFGLFGRVR